MDTSHEFLGERKQALEEAFFAQQDDALKARLRRRQEAAAHREALRSVSGITDEALLDHLVALDVQAGALSALTLIPLVTVAWANNRIEPGERRVILEAARQSGVVPGTEAHALLGAWLERRPGPELFAAWKEYIATITKRLEPSGRLALRDGILRHGREVAEASGGLFPFLRTGSVSPGEQAVLNEIERAFA